MGRIYTARRTFGGASPAWTPKQLRPSCWVESDNGFTASSWTDLSGSGHPLLQGTGASQPTSVAAQQNGIAAIRFDGSDDFMKASYAQNGPTTVFFVYRQNSFSASGSHDIIYDGATAGTTFVLCSSTVNQKFRVNAALVYDTQVADGVFAYTTVVFDASGVARVNGVQIGTGSWAGNPAGFTVAALGDGSRSTQIDILLACQVPGVVSDPNILMMEQYIRTKYAL